MQSYCSILSYTYCLKQTSRDRITVCKNSSLVFSIDLNKNIRFWEELHYKLWFEVFKKVFKKKKNLDKQTWTDKKCPKKIIFSQIYKYASSFAVLHWNGWALPFPTVRSLFRIIVCDTIEHNCCSTSGNKPWMHSLIAYGREAQFEWSLWFIDVFDFRG